jgi:hypothetical protein
MPSIKKPARQAAPRAKPAAAKPATVTNIHPDVLARIALSALTAKDAERLQLQYCTGPQTAAHKLKFAVAGFMIPYFTFAGAPSGFFRFRYLADTRTGWQVLAGEKPTRYVQPAHTPPELYLPPFVDWVSILSSPEQTLVFTEGEMKAACATKYGVPTIGLGGVWSFKSKNLRKTILDAFHDMTLSGRRCIICFDSDAASNPEVRRAEQAFAKELMGLGAEVFIARLPTLDDGTKCGLDDYIVAHGNSTESLQTLLAGAEPYALAEKLHALNEEVIVVSNPGFVWRISDRMPMTTSDFKTLHYAHWQYMDYTDPDKPRIRSAPEQWLKWQHRSSVAGMAYEPGQPHITDDNRLNQWTGWGCSPKKGSIAAWDALLDHLFAHHLESRRWFEQWVAYPIQHPGTKQHTAVVMWGRETGTGKSLLGYLIGGIYADNFAEIGDNELDPNSAFNGWCENKQFVLADDITGHNNRKLANRLKTMISREKTQVNIKFVKTYEVRDCLNYYFTSNDPDAFYLDDTDRRFFIHEAAGGKLDDKIRDACLEMRRTGLGALLYHLLNVDTSDFDVGHAAPVTDAKIEMQNIVRTDLESWLDRALSDPDAYFKGFKGDLITVDEIHATYDPMGAKREVSTSLVGRKLATMRAVKVVPKDSTSGQVRVGGKLQRLYAIRNHRKWNGAVSVAAVREHFEVSRNMIRDREGSKKPKF